MAHNVICVYCKKQFDRDKEPFVETSPRRYGHKICVDKVNSSKTQDEIDYEDLELYIKKLFKKPMSAKIKKQIVQFRRDYNYTYTGIKKTLVWWFEVQGNSLDKSNGGIGIVPYVYDDACKYYYSLFLAQAINENKQLEGYRPRIEEITIAPPTVEIAPPRLFKLEEENE